MARPACTTDQPHNWVSIRNEPKNIAVKAVPKTKVARFAQR